MAYHLMQVNYINSRSFRSSRVLYGTTYGLAVARISLYKTSIIRLKSTLHYFRQNFSRDWGEAWLLGEEVGVGRLPYICRRDMKDSERFDLYYNLLNNRPSQEQKIDLTLLSEFCQPVHYHMINTLFVQIPKVQLWFPDWRRQAPSEVVLYYRFASSREFLPNEDLC